MITIQTKITNALKANRLNPAILGERKWYNYFIRSTELVWGRNYIDGYLIEVYDEKYGNHLLSIQV